MATTMVNGAASSEGNTPNTAMPSNPGRQQSKSTNFTNKAADGNRKQANISSDGAQRRNPPQKAWTSGMNPITQRSTTPAQQNGGGPQTKSAPQKATINQEMNASDRHANDRLVYLLGNFMGLQTSVTVKNGDVFSGIFFGADVESHEPSYLLKMVQQIRFGNKSEVNGNQENLGEYIGIGDDYSMSFDIKEVADLAVDNVTFDHRDKSQNGVNAGFRTDTDISGNTAVRERNLQPWEPSAETDVDMSLEQLDGAWDQFQANEQKFGLRTDYDENMYTTRIDKSNPKYRQQEAEAARIAREIEGTSVDNPHMREERGLRNENDELDEEEKYSGVRRQGAEYPPLQSSQPNKYMPPARRLPTGKPTVPGAPVDPAIISSQIARPDAGSQELRKAVVNNENDVGSSTTKEITQPESTQEVPNNATGKEMVANNTRPSGSSKPPIPAASATANVETDVLDSFRQFANIEKMRVSDHRRQRVTQDKAIKLNDLMKFSKNFTLKTPVPKDLVPILAKDKSKQEEIMEKAQRNAEKNALAASKPTDQGTSRSQAEGSSTNTGERLEFANGRQVYPPQGPQATSRERQQQQHTNNMPLTSPKSGQGLLSHRLADSHRQHKAGMPVSVPNPIPIHTMPRNPPARPTANPPSMSESQTSSALRTPTSATSANKLNVKAPDFRPNPAANAFKPIANPSVASSPVSTTPNARPASRALSPSAFFGNKKSLPLAERPSVSENFNALKRLKEIAQNDGKADDLASNGGIRYAYQTPPTWKAPSAGEEENTISYKDMFEDAVPASNRVSPLPNSPVPQPLPHQHQLPLHLQHGSHSVPHIQTPPQMPYHVQPQPHHYPSGSHQFDDHRMHLPTSSSSVYQSPRMQHSNMAYPSPMSQPAQLAYAQQIAPYGVGPAGPQPAQFRAFPGGHQMVPAQGPQVAGASMMVHQSSQGGYVPPPHGMPVPAYPQMPVYLPPQHQVYGGQSQPPSGYPSPSRGGAPMMMQQGSHQGSHQGQHSQMYMTPSQYPQPVYAQQQPPHMMPMRGGYGSPQPHYSQSPQQQYHYPQPNRVPSNNYGPPPQGPHHHLPSQHAPPPVIPIENGEDSK